MDSTQIGKQFIDFQKTTFENFFTTMVMIQDHAEKITSTLYEQLIWLPEESKRLMDQWLDIQKKGRSDMKLAVDENFKQVKDIFKTS
jgi:hypothetical protein